MKRSLILATILAALTTVALAGEPAAPGGLKGERALPDRYPFVVQDVLKYCRPQKGFWVDLGAGKGQVAIPLIEATGNAVVMLDPDAKAMAKGLDIAREKGLAAVVGVAEKMPFPDNSVDLVVSRGAIFFFDDPAQGLREVYRVLRPGAKAMIGGGAGSGYPKWAAEKLIRRRKELAEGDEADKWRRFIELRRPEQMEQWARDARLPEFQVMGKGAISTEDPRVGQGVWVVFEKKPIVATRKDADRVSVTTEGDRTVYSIRSPSGIGGATITPAAGWAKEVTVRLYLKGLESFRASAGKRTIAASVQSHGGNARLLRVVDDGKGRPVEKGSASWMEIRTCDAKGNAIPGLPGDGGYFEMTLPKALFEDRPPSLKLEWIDFYRN